MNEKEFEELAAGHALHALSPEDESRFAAALAEHPEWSQIAEVDRRAVASLAEAVDPVAAPPSIRAELLARIATTPQTSADETAPTGSGPRTESRRRGRTSRRAWFVLAASVAILLAFGVGTIAVVTQLVRPAAVTALERIEASTDARSAQTATSDGPSATLHWSASLGEAVLVSDDLPALDPDQAFEVWFVRDDQPVSAGVFHADGAAATALLEGDVRVGDVVAVTIEPDGGSPTGQPTSQPIFTIPTA